jgi:hypothetical protein
MAKKKTSKSDSAQGISTGIAVAGAILAGIVGVATGGHIIIPDPYPKIPTSAIAFGTKKVTEKMNSGKSANKQRNTK